jgi:sugar lactone lactonase YvrE
MTRGIGAALLLASQTIVLAQPYVISTIAGGAAPPAGISATAASVPQPSGVATDTAGTVFFTSNHSVFKIDASGNLLRVAGIARAGYSGDGGPATNAQLNTPYGLALDPSGNLYVADSGNHRIRRIAPGGLITTVAGTGVPGFSGDSGPAATAQLNSPVDVAVDASGNLYIADAYNQRVRKIAQGTITTVAGDGTCCFSGDNGPASKAQLHQPEGLAVDTSGNLYIADLGNNRIRKVSPAGVITTVAGLGSSGFGGDNGPATSAQLQIAWAVAVDPSGNLYIADGDRVRKVSGGTITTVAGMQFAGFSGDGAAANRAQLNGALGIAVDSSGNLYVADTGNNRVRKIAAAGVISTIAGDGTHNFSGDGGAAVNAQMYNPQGIALGAGGAVYVSEFARVRRFAVGGAINTVAGTGVSGYFGDSGGAASAQLNQPQGLAFDPASGTLYIADTANNRIRKLMPNGNVALVAGTGTAGYSGDNGSATAAQLRSPEAVALDAAGNLYVADTGNGAIRKITPAGAISTIAGNGTQGYAGDGGPAAAAQFAFPRGLTVDASGNLYIADFGNGRVRKIANGAISTVAGANSNSQMAPQGVAVDAAGALYIADFNNYIWKVAPDGTATAIAGTGTSAYTGDGGSAAAAQISDVHSIAVDATGNVYFADASNHAVRMLRPVSTLLTITTSANLPAASVGASYSQQLSASGGTAPLTWTVNSGSLPRGLSLSPAGLISGTPAAAGSSTFSVQVADAALAIATLSFTLTVTVPAITTNSPLLQGTVGLNYSQTLSATGGAPPYTWTLLSGALPPGLALSSTGVITGIPTAVGTSNVTIKVVDAAANTATQDFTIVVLSAPSLTRSGVLAHVAAGGGWSTTVYLANVTSNQIAVAITIRTDDGTALNLPLTVTQQGASQNLTTSTVNTTIGPNSTVVLEMGQQVSELITGWADVATSGPVNGFAIFRSTAGAISEGTSPLQTQFQSKLDLPYDNRSGFVTAIALANVSAAAATLTANVWDSTGVSLGTQSITIPAGGHTAFVLPDKLPQTAGLQGLVQFQSSAGNLAAVGLRVSPQGTFTSVPVILP